LLDTAIYHCQQAAEKAVKGFAEGIYTFVLTLLPEEVHPE
jgi:hypothetical protein